MRGESAGQGQSAAEEARFDLGLEHEWDSEKVRWGALSLQEGRRA